MDPKVDTLSLSAPFSGAGAARAFAALGSESRLAVLRALVRAGPAGLTMGALARRTGSAASTLNHHVRLLAEAGLVTQERQGRSIICAAASFDVVEQLSTFLLMQCCVDAPVPEQAG